MFDLILRGAVIGLAATALIDLWAVVLERGFGLPRPNWGLVGRWVWHLRGGKVFHDNIRDAAPYSGELALGWVFHYAVGLLYGVILALLTGRGWFEEPTFLPAFILGMVTIGAGWFLLAPGMGAGWASSRAPNPAKVRALNIVSHTVFALGLYGTALLIG